jgi:hypothetical protein
MHNLVACGASDPTNPTDNAMFSDFKKISSTLMLMKPEIEMASTFTVVLPTRETH